ncbi:hypothetical protein H0A58_08985 [Alcaligenaceae bacterium]|nr:hypothetical protein [Alcaligenaceae bacterium]
MINNPTTRLPEPLITGIVTGMSSMICLREPVATEGSGKAPKEQRAHSEAQSRAQSDQILATPLSANELVALLGLKSETGVFKRTIKKTLEIGLSEYTLPDSFQSRLQKYRVTEKGIRVSGNNG